MNTGPRRSPTWQSHTAAHAALPLRCALSRVQIIHAALTDPAPRQPEAGMPLAQTEARA